MMHQSQMLMAVVTKISILGNSMVIHPSMTFVGGENARPKEGKENYMTGFAFTVMGRLCVALPVNSVGFGKLCGCTFHRLAIFGTAVFL